MPIPFGHSLNSWSSSMMSLLYFSQVSRILRTPLWTELGVSVSVLTAGIEIFRQVSNQQKSFFHGSSSSSKLDKPFILWSMLTLFSMHYYNLIVYLLETLRMTTAPALVD